MGIYRIGELSAKISNVWNDQKNPKEIAYGKIHIKEQKSALLRINWIKQSLGQ